MGFFSVLRLRKNLNWRAIRMNGQGMNLLKFRTWVSVNRAAAVLLSLLPSRMLADQAALDGTSLTLPQVGEHCLRVLDPGTLELLRINGMPPGGTVDS